MSHYLYPSDHFGLVADFMIGTHRGSGHVDGEFILPIFSEQRTTGYRSIPTIIAMRSMGVIAIAVGVIAATIIL